MIASPPRNNTTPSSFPPSNSPSRIGPSPVCHYCRVAGYIMPYCYCLKKDRAKRKYHNQSPIDRSSKSVPFSHKSKKVTLLDPCLPGTSTSTPDVKRKRTTNLAPKQRRHPRHSMAIPSRSKETQFPTSHHEDLFSVDSYREEPRISTSRGKEKVLAYTLRRGPRKGSITFSLPMSKPSRLIPPPVCHYCGIAGHIRPNCYRLRRGK
ncbi:hypothetical protein U1Q18_017976, partial [Sarracenia purpurea var. burkii]